MSFNAIIKRKIIAVVLLLLVLSAIVISIIYYHAPVKDILLFVLYNLIYIQIPGSLILSMLQIKFKSSITKYPLGYAIGLFLLLMEYFVFMGLHIGDLIKWINPVLLVILIIYCIIKKKNILYEKHEEKRYASIIPFFLFLCIVFLASMLSLQFKYMNPEYVKYISLYPDMVWHMGNINAASQSWPIMDPHIYGMTFNYHYFSDVLYGICLKIFGISSDVMLYSCAPYLITYLFGCSTYSFFRENLKGNAGIYAIFFLTGGMALECICVANLTSFDSLINGHILENVNSVAYGISFLMLAVIILRYYEKKSLKRYILIECILVAMTTGMKGPLGMVLVGGLFLAEIVQIFIKKRLNMNSLKILIGTLLSFLVIYFVIISGIYSPNAQMAGSTLSLSLTGTTGVSVFGMLIDNYVLNTFNARILKVIAIIPEFLVIFMGYSIPILYCSVWYFKNNILLKKRNTDFMLLKVFLILFTGVLAFFCFSHDGVSQVYFLFSVIPIAALLTFFVFENDSCRKKKFIKIWYTVGMCVGIIFFVSSLINGLKIDYRYLTTVEKNVNNSEETYGYITQDEYQAMIWLRENADKRYLCVCDRQALINAGYDSTNARANRFFYYSAYSQCRFYLEGIGYSGLPKDVPTEQLFANNQQFYVCSSEDRVQLCKENNIKYIIVSKYLYDSVPDLRGEKINMCFTNAAVDIYEIDNE